MTSPIQNQPVGIPSDCESLPKKKKLTRGIYALNINPDSPYTQVHEPRIERVSASEAFFSTVLHPTPATQRIEKIITQTFGYPIENQQRAPSALSPREQNFEKMDPLFLRTKEDYQRARLEKTFYDQNQLNNYYLQNQNQRSS